MKKPIVFLLILALACSFLPFAAAESGRLDGAGYDTPEEALLAYIDALNRGDVGGMLSTFALESYVEHADPSVQINVRGFFLTHDLLSIPCPDDYSRSLVLHARYGSLATSLLQSVVECAAKLDGRPISFETSEDRKEFAALFADSPLNGLIGHVEFVRWLSPVDLTDGSFPDSIVMSGTPLALSGGDDYTELAALLEINGYPAVQAMQCVRYGEKWYNLQFGGVCASALGWTPLEYPLHILTPEERQKLEAAVASAYPEENARWDALGRSGLSGARFSLSSLTAGEIAVHNSPEDAQADGGMGLWAELHFFRTGAAMVTLAASPALQEKLSMDDAVARLLLSWTPGEGVTEFAYGAVAGRPVNPLYPADIQYDFSGFSVISGESSVTFIFPDGTEAVFSRP